MAFEIGHGKETIFQADTSVKRKRIFHNFFRMRIRFLFGTWKIFHPFLNAFDFEVGCREENKWALHFRVLGWDWIGSPCSDTFYRISEFDSKMNRKFMKCIQTSWSVIELKEKFVFMMKLVTSYSKTIKSKNRRFLHIKIFAPCTVLSEKHHLIFNIKYWNLIVMSMHLASFLSNKNLCRCDIQLLSLVADINISLFP